MTGNARRGGRLSRIRSVMLAGAAVVALIATAGCAVDTSRTVPGAVGAGQDQGSGSAAARQIVLRFDQQVVPATLADGAAAREFSAMLPVTVNLSDPMGQAKSGPLPVWLDPAGAELVTDPSAGGIYYAPSSGTIAIFYLDLGQSVPDGMVQLGTVDADLPSVAAAGHRVVLRIYPTVSTSN